MYQNNIIMKILWLVRKSIYNNFMSLILYQTKYYNNTINLEIASNSLVLIHFFLCVCPGFLFTWVFITPTALIMKWLLSSLCTHKGSRIPCRWKSFITLVVCIWFFSGVCWYMPLHMSFKIVSTWKSCVTLIAFIWILTSVCNSDVL